MSADSIAAFDSRKLILTGWIVTGLAAAGLLFSGGMKLFGGDMVAKEFVRLGFSENLTIQIGALELACTALYLIPQTSILGAILLTGYLGGATVAHVRLAEGFAPPIILGIVVWLGIFLREPRLRAILPLRSPG